MPPIILFCLNKDLTRILQKHLSKNRWYEDKCVAEILALLERPQYRRELLFRDYSQFGKLTHDKTISQAVDEEHFESTHQTYWNENLFYVSMLLTRRIQLAKSLKHQPTNMHQLLVLLCRKSMDQRWLKTTLARQLVGKTVIEDFFQTTAKILFDQQVHLNESYSVNAINRMAEFGPYWLNVQSSSVQVAEEFALVHVLRATPFPLLESFYCPKTEVFDKDWQIAFSRVLETLNDRYGLLRSLGLKPELWLDREKPSEYGDEVENLKNMKLVLSTNNLQELLVLKNRVSANQGLEDLANLLSIEMAYHQAFDNLKGSAKKWGGFESFFDFRNSEVGHHLLGLALEEIDVEQYIGEEDVSQLNHPLDEYTVQQRMRDLVEDQPELFDPVMAYFFLEALGRQRSLFGPDGILEESEFRELISDTTEYSSLSDEALVILLEKKTKELIQNQLKKEAAAGGKV